MSGRPAGDRRPGDRPGGAAARRRRRRAGTGPAAGRRRPGRRPRPGMMGMGMGLPPAKAEGLPGLAAAAVRHAPAGAAADRRASSCSPSSA